MDSNSWRAKGPSDLRNEGGILSGPAAPLPFIFLMADCISLIRSFSLIDRLISFTTSVYPLLAILMDCLMEAIAVADLGSHMWSHPRFRSFIGFRFPNVGSSSGD